MYELGMSHATDVNLSRIVVLYIPGVDCACCNVFPTETTSMHPSKSRCIVHSESREKFFPACHFSPSFNRGKLFP